MSTEKEISPSHPPTSPVGSPSTDLFNTPVSSTFVFEQPNTIVPSPQLREQTSLGSSVTNTDPLTGGTGDTPLVGILSQDEINSSPILTASSTPSIPFDAVSNAVLGKTQPQYAITQLGETGDLSTKTQLTDSILEVFRNEAAARWASLGITQEDKQQLENVKLLIADLPGYQLGWTEGDVVTLDEDAAGSGWFVDSSVAEDSEFSNIVSASELLANETDPAFGRVDLLTVITHEFGHVLGIDHVGTDRVMSPTLPRGTRRLLIAGLDNLIRGNDPINDAAELALPTISANNGTVNSDLSTTDVMNPTRNGSFSDDYELINFTVGKLVTLNLSSPSFDTYLQLINADTGQVIANDDGSGEGGSSLLRWTPIEGIKYTVRVTSYSNNVTGTYTLNANVGAPDLLVTNAIAPTTAAERSIIALSWTVTNQGEVVATNDWYDYVYLSDNTILDNSDRYMGYLGTGDRTPLAPSASYTVTTNMALPERIGAGKQYLLFVADRDNYQIEESETNNVRAVPIDITVPDLVVTGATAPVGVTVGSSAELTWTVKNEGNVEATHSWYDHIYLSNDLTWDGSDQYVSVFDSGTSGTPVAVGDTYTLTKTVIIPNTVLGNRYLLFVADANNNQYETNENNNVKAIPVEVNAPDLIVADATAPSSATLGEEITVNWQVTNQGNVIADGDWYDYFYLSDDQVLDDSDQYISYKWTGELTPLASNTSYSATHNLTIPTHAKAGNRYLLLVADRDNYQGETNENNNVKAVPIYINAPELVVAEANTPTSANSGDSIDVSWTIKNLGDTTSTGQWYDHVFLSYDAVYDSSDTYLTSNYNSIQLAPLGSYSVEQNVTLPTSFVGSPGNRYLLFVADTNNYQSETNEGNNVLAVPFTINGQNSDLSLSAATAPSTAVVGQQIPIEWTVTNSGSVATTSYDWYDYVYLSSTPTLNSEAVYLTYAYSGNYNSYQPLAVGSSYTIQRNVILPNNVNGDRYLLFVADQYNYQGDADKSNNVKVVPITIEAPDLVVSNATAPQQAYAGARIEASWTVTNQGNGSALQPRWNYGDYYGYGSLSDWVYLSDDDTLDTNTDTLLKDIQTERLLPLESGAGYTITQLLSVPNTVTKGSKYLLFAADGGKSLGETNENNNVKAVAISIVDPDPNLPLLQSGSPVQNQNSPQSSSNPNYGTYGTLEALLDVTTLTGLLGEYYVPGGIVNNFPNYDALAPLLTRVDPCVNFGSTWYDFGANLGQTDHFAARWTGKINIATEGDVTFSINSDDGARLYINDRLVVDNGGVHGFQEHSATIYLTPGQHDLRLEYFEYDWYAGVTLSYTPVGGSKQVIPSSILTPARLTPLESDLRLSDVTAPTTFGLGQTISTSWTVTNVGTSSTQSAWTDQIYLSDDTTLDSKDTRLGSPVGRTTPLAELESYTQAQNIVIPTNAGLGNKYLLFVTNPDKPESNRTNNAYALPITIIPPDLIVTQATAPLTASERESITVNWTVKNQGSVPTQSNGWYDSVYLSENTVFDDSDRYMGDFWINAQLAESGTYSKSQKFTLPERTGSGKWYLLVITDRYGNYQAETSDANNVYAIPIDITIPDLTVTTGSAPTTAAVGDTVSVSWTVKNSGAVSAASDWYDSVYLSDDNKFDTTDTYVTNFSRNASEPLASGATDVRTGDLVIPQDKLGDRYLLIVSDRGNYQSETDETNNVWATPITITAPDLVVSDATAPIAVGLGETVSVSWSVTNSGDVIASRDWYDSIYLSDDTTFDGSDEYITDHWNYETTPLGALSSYNVTSNVTIPTYVKAGNRYLLFVADRHNYQGETNENNNVKAVPIYIKASDLVVSDAGASANSVAPGSTFELSYTVQNQGQIATNPQYNWWYGRGWYDHIYLSNDAIYDSSDSYLNERWIDTETSLAVDGSYTVSNINVTLPNNSVGQPGSRYLLFVSDRYNNQNESDERNNVKAIPITITGENADLEVTTATAPSVVSTQQNISVSWTVKNTGTLSASADWYDFVYISSDNTLDASDTRVGDQWVWSQIPLAANGEYSLNRNITIPQDRTGSQYLLFVADAYNYQSELSKANNLRAVPITVLTPDLVVTDATAPAKSYPSTQIELSWKVKNQGNTSANTGWYDRIYLSDDTTFNTSTDTLLKEIWMGNLTPLAVENDYTVSQLLTLPSTIPIGGRYLLIVTDIHNAQGETNENNNIRAIPIVIGDAEPDLTITTATAPSTAVLGETIALNWTVLNQGNRQATADWYDTIYLSDDQTLDASDVAVSDQNVAEKTPLAVGATYNFNRNITIPNTTVGNRYLLIVADAGSQQSETNETNNLRAVPITLTAPDLVVSSASTGVSAATWGETIQVEWTVTNTETQTAATTWSDQIYLSDDTILDGTDQFVASFSASEFMPMSGNSSYTQASKNITIPTHSGTGSKYLLFVADANNAQGETDNNNNTKAIPFFVKAPNLQVSQASAPTTATWNESINISVTVTNQGTGDALSDWWDSVYLSANPTLDSNDIYLGNLSAANQSPLESGASYSKNHNVTIPSVTPGDWYLLIATDNNGNQLAEINETDNVRSVALSVTAPDLVVSAVSAPQNSILGATISVSWTVTNQGTGAALADWWDHVYLSANPTLDSNDTSIGYQWAGENTPLAAGMSYTNELNITLPKVEQGTWYLLFATDLDNYQPETNNNNNVTPVAIELGAPDIELTAATAPLTASVNQTIQVGWTVTNTGNITAPADWWDSVYLSDNTTLDDSDTQLGALSATNETPLAALTHYTQTLNVTLPGTIRGNKYLLFVTDRDNTQGESNESNNVRFLPLTINAPDLIVSDATAPNRAILGETIDVSWTVANSGIGDAFADWYDSIYLSDDTNLDAQDTSVADYWNADNTPLASQATYPVTRKITIPFTTTGNRYLLFVGDRTNLQGETNENNNIKAIPITLGSIDLVPTITTSPTTVTSGTTVSLGWSVSNTGTASVTDNWVDRIYLSIDNKFDSSDLFLKQFQHDRPLGASSNYTTQLDVDLPIEFSGNYYLLLVTDADGQVKEISGEENNVAYSAVQIQLGEYADLAVSNVTVSSSLILRDQVPAPATLGVNWTVTNTTNGTGAGQASKWYDRIIASADSEIGNNDDIVLASFLHEGALAKGAFYQRTEVIALPNYLQGKYKLFVQTDADIRDENGKIIYSVFENGLEANNTAGSPSQFAVALKPYADLVVTKVETNATASTGSFFRVNWEVKNLGISVTDSASWYDRVQLARKTETGSFEILRTLDSFDRTGALSHESGKNTYTRSRDVFIPYDLEPGTYYLGVTTAGSNNPYEFIYTDNNTSFSQAIEIARGNTPDLFVNRISTIPEALAGSKIDVTWQVFNSNALNTGDGGGEWYDSVYLRNIATGFVYGLGSFKQTNGLVAGKFYTQTESFTLDSRLEGTYEVVVETNIADRYGNRGVYEQANALANNTLTSTSNLTVILPNRPDLRVNSIDVPLTSVSAGGTAFASFEIINLSQVEAKGKWVDNVYLSLDGFIDSGDTLIGSFNNDSALLGLGKYKHDLANFEIPKYFRDRAYIIVQTDAGNSINEYPQDGNNTLVKELKITSLPPADLVANHVVSPDQAFAGAKIKVNYKVTNSGAGETDRDRWTDSIWLTRTSGRPSSNSREGGERDILLGNFTHTGTLQIKNDYNGTNFYENEVEVTLPTVLQGGQWYITVWSDAYNNVYEDTFSNNSNQNDANELDSNNYASSPIEVLLPAAPDLQIVSVTPTEVAMGGTPFKVTWTVKNNGNVDITSGSWYDEVYLTDAPSLEASTVKWYLGNVGRDQQLARSATYTSELETVLSPGATGQYIIVTTNPLKEIWEGPYTNNNTYVAPTLVTSISADFAVTNIKTFTPNYSGDPTTIEWTVTNNGASVWEGTRYWYDEVWISKESTFNGSNATFLGLFAQNLPKSGLGTGQSYTQKQTVTLPVGIKDDYYIHVFTNLSLADASRSGGLPATGWLSNYWERVGYETSAYEDTSNNYKSAKIPVIFREADLEISNLQIETPQPGIAPTSGETIAVNWKVSNIGTRDTRESIWYDRVYLSIGKDDNSLDAQDIFLGEYKRTGILKQGESYTQRQEFILPDNISGDFKVIVFTDSNYNFAPYRENNLGFEWYVSREMARVPEFSKEDNNQALADLYIEFTEAPDLQVTALEVQEQRALRGQKLNLEYTVTNRGGNTPPRQSEWNDLIYLSRDRKLDILADRYLGSIPRTGGLNGNSSYTNSSSFYLPTDLDGSYYVFVVTDPTLSNPRGNVFEGSNEGNNNKHSAQPLIIELPPPVDLKVTNITIPNSTQVGDPVTVKWSVVNDSNNSMTGSWTDAVYLSNDDKWDIGDRLIGRKTFSGTLAGIDPTTLTPGSYEQYIDISDNIFLPGVTPDNYRLIVRTDIFNEVYEGVEGGESNNLKASEDSFKVNASGLQLNVGQATTLTKGQERLFELNVDAGQTIRITTDGTEASGNEIYVGFNVSPTSTKYITASKGIIGSDQTAIVSNTQQGKYYVLLRGISGNETPVTIKAEALPFGITDIATDRGGDSRYVTTTISGAQFQKGATVKLVRPGIGEYIPDRWEVVDSTKITAIFDLRNAPHGLYDVKVTNPDGESAIVPYRYLIERAIETDVTVGLGGPNILAPGETGNYAVSVKSLTNIDTPYVHLSFGIPELGSNPILELPYVQFSSNLSGQPQNNPQGKLDDVPWASIVSNVNLNGQILAPGYILDLPNAGFTGANFSVQIYPGFQELLQREPELLEDLNGDDLAFKFPIVATATAMTRAEFVAEQKLEALRLRSAILQDKTATPTLTILAADADTWTNAFLAALEQAGLLRPDNVAPPIRENPQVISLMATLATGLLVGPAGQAITSTGNLVSFFENIRKWYGHDASKIGSNDIPNLQQFDRGLSRATQKQAFNIYVPFKDARVELPPGVAIPAPNFNSAFITPSSTSNLVSLTGPLGYGNNNIIPVGVELPYTIRFENAGTAPTAVGKVQLVTKLDSDLDPRTFQLGGIKLGDIQVNIPTGRSFFQGDFDFTATKGFILGVSAGIDLATNTASWLLEAIDPNTLEVVQNPNVGILLPNDAKGAGAGFVSYTIAAKENSITGTEITSSAKVLFNTASPIDTNRIVNIIDGVAPTATLNVTPLNSENSPSLTPSLSPSLTDYRVTWNATDDASGSGVKHITVYVAENGGDFKVWKSQTQEKEAIYSGLAGSRYEFLALATDNAGNKQAPPLGIITPNDGFSVNLGSIPTVSATTKPDILPPAPPSQQISTNELFIQAKAENNTPATLPTTNKPEFEIVLRPFSASAFATGIPKSHGNLGAMAIAVLPDGTVLASGGTNRGSLYRFSSQGTQTSPTPLVTLSQPIFDMSVDRNGTLWATTGGGPLLQLNSQTGQIVKQYGDSITQTLAIHPTTGSIYVSSGNGIEIFNPIAETFTHYSDLRVDSLAFAPDGSLWGTSWPDRGLVVKFDAKGRAQQMLSFSEEVDSLAFGATGSRLAGLAFVSTNNGDVLMVDLATLQHIKVATGKQDGTTWGENIEVTPDGRVLISHSGQIDVLNPTLAPKVSATNPVKDAIVALPQNIISVTFDSDMFAGASNYLASVLNPNNYQLIGGNSNIINPVSVRYDTATKSALLGFNTFDAGNYEFKVLQNIKSTAGVELETAYSERFTTVSNFSSLVDFNFSNARSHRAEGTISFDVTITSKADQDLLLPVMLLLDPSATFTGVPNGAVGRTDSGAYLLDLKDSLPDGRLKSGASTTVRTITVNNPDALRVEFTPGIYAMPYPNLAPVITSTAVTTATLGQDYSYQISAFDPDGSVLGYLLYDAPTGMTVDANGLINWTPVAGSTLQEKVVLYTYDLRGGYTTQSFTINVAGANNKPVFTTPAVSGGTIATNDSGITIRSAEGKTLQIKVAANDSDRDKLTYWAPNLPGGAVFDPKTGILTWTPNYS
ncbi:hypothetical protein NUACC21_53380 [Scytonema sp. NUACC21]